MADGKGGTPLGKGRFAGMQDWADTVATNVQIREHEAKTSKNAKGGKR